MTKNVDIQSQNRGAENKGEVNKLQNMRRLQFDFDQDQDGNLDDYEYELSTARRELDKKLLKDQSISSNIFPPNEDKSRISLVEIIDEGDKSYLNRTDKTGGQIQDKERYIIPKYRSYEASLKMRKQLDFVNFGETLQIREKEL